MKSQILGELLLEVCEKNKGNLPIPVYSVTNSEGFIVSNEYFSKQVFSKNLKTYKIVHKGDFAYNPSRINVGSVDYFKDQSSGLISPLYVTFRVSDSLDKQYLKYFLKSEYGLFQISKNTSGSVRDTLSFKQLSKIYIPLYEFGQQQVIVKRLELVESVLEKRKYTIALLDRYLQSVFLEIFGDPLTNPKKWNKESLKKFGEIITGNTPSRTDKSNYSDNYIEWIKTDNIVEREMYITEATEFLSKSGLVKARYVTSGAVLVVCIAGSVESIGRVALVDRKVSFNQQINAIQPKHHVNCIFLYWLLKISRSYIQKQAARGMKKILTKGEFQKIEMILPPKKLQDEFEMIALKVTGLKQKMFDQSKELDNQFKALMQKSFEVN